MKQMLEGGYPMLEIRSPKLYLHQLQTGNFKLVTSNW